MASTASALSLSNFQPITSTSVPLGCILAYNKQIPSCTMNDFTRGNVCSAACVRALTTIQYTLISACNDADVDAGTVLGQVLLANLVDLLCPGTSPAATGSSLSRSSSNSPTLSPTTTTTTTTNVARTTTSSKTVLTFTVVRPSSTTTTSSSNSRVTTSTTTRAETSSAPEQTAAPDTSIPFQQSERPSSTSAASSSSRAPAASPDPNTQNSSGGGSPFDAVTSDARRITTCWAAMWAGLGVGLLFLR
ncbi:hypothetical protein C8A05DRAFT_47857 [Staphylotrichum tortipilum]|uniref:Uncharacterized protein n=1 Tax=Staphylotrichum tortipilum TaxID=2831512 RepID=A0AAN6MCS2_9PEZI|nr:hypothetical protein C8A05DRAFT_47857 [Staphylotrichum longicolle]